MFSSQRLFSILRKTMMPEAQLLDFVRRYTAAWCSQDPASVAMFYSPTGSLTINGGEPAVGREAITQSAKGFMDAFPDLQVEMAGLEVRDEGVVYRWTLNGTNSGPGGRGHQVRISGFEKWRIGDDGLISESQGHFDSAEYERQVAGGVAS